MPWVPVGLGGHLSGQSACALPLPPCPGTHRVVSWLMLVKEELLKELILLLLKSLEDKNTLFRKEEL